MRKPPSDRIDVRLHLGARYCCIRVPVTDVNAPVAAAPMRVKKAVRRVGVWRRNTKIVAVNFFKNICAVIKHTIRLKLGVYLVKQ